MASVGYIYHIPLRRQLRSRNQCRCQQDNLSRCNGTQDPPSCLLRSPCYPEKHYTCSKYISLFKHQQACVCMDLCLASQSMWRMISHVENDFTCGRWTFGSMVNRGHCIPIDTLQNVCNNSNMISHANSLHKSQCVYSKNSVLKTKTCSTWFRKMATRSPREYSKIKATLSVLVHACRRTLGKCMSTLLTRFSWYSLSLEYLPRLTSDTQLHYVV